MTSDSRISRFCALCFKRKFAETNEMGGTALFIRGSVVVNRSRNEFGVGK